MDSSHPLAAGSISLRLYPHSDLPAEEVVRELRAQAAMATRSGFDGVMTSEHHGGFSGYMPNPLQAAGWLLERGPDERHVRPGELEERGSLARDTGG